MLVSSRAMLTTDQTWFFLQEFAGNRPEEACQALLFYMERCRVLDGKPGRQPGHALALEVPRTRDASYHSSI